MWCRRSTSRWSSISCSASPCEHGTAGRSTSPTYLLATYGAFGVMNVALFGFGVGVAIERGQGWMLFKRATPMPPFAYFFGKLAMALLFAVVMVALPLHPRRHRRRRAAARRDLVLARRRAGGRDAAVRAPSGSPWATGRGPTRRWRCSTSSRCRRPSARGCGSRSRCCRPGASGSPSSCLPTTTPNWRCGTLGLDRGDRRAGSAHVAFLAAFTVVSLLLAWIGYRRDEGKTFG